MLQHGRPMQCVVAKEVEVDVGQDNLRMNSPLLPPLPPLLILELESVEEAKRLLLLLLLMLVCCVTTLCVLLILFVWGCELYDYEKSSVVSLTLMALGICFIQR